MIERYSRPEMANIWTEENKYRAWLEVEILADEAWAELGEIPKEDVALIREKADFDIDRILEIEQQTRHDVVAFTRAVSETLGEERKWVHYGLTSTDVVDTAYGYLYKQANDIIRKVYTSIAGISTVLAGLMTAIAAIAAKISNNQQRTDQAVDWIKRIWVCWAVINSIGAILAYIVPLFDGFATLPE